jgi:hypothetical protein
MASSNQSRIKPTPLSQNMKDDWHTAAAEMQLSSIWPQIDKLLSKASLSHPFRTHRLKRDLKWLRMYARRNGVNWG